MVNDLFSKEALRQGLIRLVDRILEGLKVQARQHPAVSQAFEATRVFFSIMIPMLIGMSIFEVLTHHLFPEMRSVGVDFPLIVFSSFAASVVAYRVLGKYRLLHQEARDEILLRKQVEESVKRERDRFMNILESMEDGVYMVSQGYDIEYVNPVIQKEFGPVQGRKCYQYFHDRTEVCPWCKNQEVFAGKAVRWTWFSPKTAKTYDLFDAPLRNADGTLSKLEIFRDVSELVQVQEALRASEEHFRVLFNRANDCIFVLELTPEGTYGKYVEVNEMACRTFGYTRKELLDLTPMELIASENAHDVSLTRQELLDKKQLLFERMLMTRDGRRIPFELNINLFEHKGRNTLVVIARNILERHQAELALRESEAKFRRLSEEFSTLLTAISDTLILLSPDLKVLWANNGTAYGHDDSISGMTGHFCYELCHGRAAPCDDCPALRSFAGGRVETLLANRDGRFLDIKAFPIKEEGNINSVLLVASDITEKLTLQAEAMQATHLASLGELAAGVAHEINNPINGIINYAQILANKSEKHSREYEIGVRIMKESDRIANIVKSLLSYTRQGEKERKPRPVHGILSDCLTLSRSQIRKERIVLRTDLPDSLPRVVVNSQEIQQVFLNVLNNARFALNQKYPGAHEGKTLDILGEAVEIAGDPFVRITFLDAGTGIPASVLSKVTTPFFSTKPDGKGTGLGLAISLNIINEHSGRLAIDSVEGEYTRVIIELPARIEDEGQNSRD